MFASFSLPCLRSAVHIPVFLHPTFVLLFAANRPAGRLVAFRMQRLLHRLTTALLILLCLRDSGKLPLQSARRRYKDIRPVPEDPVLRLAGTKLHFLLAQPGYEIVSRCAASLCWGLRLYELRLQFPVCFLYHWPVVAFICYAARRDYSYFI